MQIRETLSHLDTLLHQCRLDEAETYLTQAIAQAQTAQDTESEKLLRNEQIGFYRDCGKFPQALDTAAKARALFENAGETDSVSYATTLLNCANAYRAAGKHADAFAAYETVQQLYQRLLPPTDGRVASLWNNLALLYQETEQWEQACSCLKQALALVKHDPDQTRTAISAANLAVSLLRLRRTEEALAYLEQADRILAGKTPSDFHYSAVLAGFGDAYYQQGKYAEAADAYEKALPEIELHMGQNNFYAIVSDNLTRTYARLGGSRPALSGLELCRKYYEAFGAPMLERSFGDILPRLAVGLAGEGSECLGYDDALSRDHDFGAGFCIWIPDDLPEETVQQLRNAYAALPKSYYGITRTEMPEAEGRVGVCRQSAFFRRLLGTPGVPETESEWLAVQDGMLAAACSGAVFRDDAGTFSAVRRRLALGYPEEVRLRLLAQALGRMAQCGQYNYTRMRRRDDIPTAQLYLAEFCKAAMQAKHLLCGSYAPYEKWLLRSTGELPGGAALAQELKQLLCLSPAEDGSRYIESICSRIRKETADMEKKPQENADAFLADTAGELAAQAQALEQHKATVERLAELEFRTFDKVQGMGGRAACQDDWETFSIMRRSQYLPWEEELLEQWLAAFQAAADAGRNLIMEKYARMMESTDPAEYAAFADQLPALSPEFIRLREAIIAIQIPWMEEFAAQYPHLASRARVIHTAEDSPAQTSYETYLRGELSVYPFEVLYGYGRWVVSLHQAGENLTCLTMAETVRAYGYGSLEDAERACGETPLSGIPLEL